MPEERGVIGHHVLEMAVLRAVLHHQNLAIALDDGRLDLADLLVDQNLVVLLAVEDFLPNLRHAFRTQRVSLARPPERRLDLLVGLQQRPVSPRRDERRALLDLVQAVVDHPPGIGQQRHSLFGILDRLVHLHSCGGTEPSPVSIRRVRRQSVGFAPSRLPNTRYLRSDEKTRIFLGRAVWGGRTGTYEGVWRVICTLVAGFPQPEADEANPLHRSLPKREVEPTLDPSSGGPVPGNSAATP